MTLLIPYYYFTSIIVFNPSISEFNTRDVSDSCPYSPEYSLSMAAFPLFFIIIVADFITTKSEFPFHSAERESIISSTFFIPRFFRNAFSARCSLAFVFPLFWAADFFLL